MNYKINPFYLQSESIDADLMAIMLANQWFLRHCRCDGLSQTQSQIILLCKTPQNADDICYIIGMSRQNFHQQYPKIDQYLHRTTAPNDRRKTLYSLNDAGVALRQKMVKNAIDQLTNIYKNNPPPIIAGFQKILQDIHHV